MKCVTTLEGINPDMLKGGFFVNWPNPPTPRSIFSCAVGSTACVSKSGHWQ